MKDMYICESCGRILSDDELINKSRYVSDYMGGCYESETTCPCGGDVAEAKRCAECGEYFNEDELYGGMCGECLHKEMTVGNALNAGDAARENVLINGFLASYFSKNEIDEILKSALEHRMKTSHIMERGIVELAESWCEDDVWFFADWIKSKNRGKKNDKR